MVVKFLKRNSHMLISLFLIVCVLFGMLFLVGCDKPEENTVINVPKVKCISYHIVENKDIICDIKLSEDLKVEKIAFNVNRVVSVFDITMFNQSKEYLTVNLSKHIFDNRTTVENEIIIVTFKVYLVDNKVVYNKVLDGISCRFVFDGNRNVDGELFPNNSGTVVDSKFDVGYLESLESPDGGKPPITSEDITNGLEDTTEIVVKSLMEQTKLFFKKYGIWIILLVVVVVVINVVYFVGVIKRHLKK